MKKTMLISAALLAACSAGAQNYDDWFLDKTLRLDYVIAGNDKKADIYLQSLASTPGWGGRRANLSEPYLEGNGQITVRDSETGQVIYVQTYSTLFQEWQTEEEATKVNKAFEATNLVPFPKKPVEITVTLTDNHRKESARITHVVDPSDILICPKGEKPTPHRYIMKNGSSADCVDIALVAEGYTEADSAKFLLDAQRAVDAIFTHEPFQSLKDRFNVIAVQAVSEEQSPTIPRKGEWHDTAVGTHYDTFYSNRYLMSEDVHHLYDLLAGIPFDQVIVLVNADTYGGGGIFNQLTISTTDHPTFKNVLVHEFGHGYGGLADEYFYDDGFVPFYPLDTEPWEPNITTLVDFDSKWKDMVPAGTQVPTPPDPNIPSLREIFRNKDKKGMELLNACTQKVGVFEGGGYTSKGVYRPVQECRMKINEVENFCPVCTRAIIRATDFYTGR